MDSQAPTTEHGWVKVTNISPAATEAEIKSLFGFCGFVNAIHMSSDSATGTQIAVIEFYDKNAVSTAALLTNAIIQDLPIKVELYIASTDEQSKLSAAVGETPKPSGPDPVAAQSKTAVMAKILAGGYKLASDCKDKAIAWDTGKLNLVQKIEALGHTVSAQANEINVKYGLVEKGNAVLVAATGKATEIGQTVANTEAYKTTMAKVTEIDQKLNISKTAGDLFGFAMGKATQLVNETTKEIAILQSQSAQAQPQAQPQPGQAEAVPTTTPLPAGPVYPNI